MGLLDIFKKIIMIETVIAVDKRPSESDYLTREEFDNVEVGNYIHRFTCCRPYSKGKFDYNGTRRVISNDRVKKELTLVDIHNKNHETKIYYSGKEHHGMTEGGQTLRGSESFECYYNEKYTKTTIS